jgi:hypothetical protein
MRTLGGAIGGQISATLIAAHTLHGLPRVTGFTQTDWMSAGFLVVAALAGSLVPAFGSRFVAPAASDALAHKGAAA